MDWENILSGKSIEIIFQTLNDDGDLSSFSGSTLWRYLKELKARGIITKLRVDTHLILASRSLPDFLKEYERYFVTKISKTFSENSVILWQKNMEFLYVRVPKSTEAPSGDFHKTATSLFSQYNLLLFLEFDVYFHSTTKKTIKPRTLCCTRC